MFDIGFDTHAATSLRVRVKELPTITEQIAAQRQLPWVKLVTIFTLAFVIKFYAAF